MGFDWNVMQSIEEFKTLVEASENTPFFLFKHSGRCSISGMIKNKLETSFIEKNISEKQQYLLDVVRNRSISQHVAENTGIRHESPQMLVFKNQECVLHDSHYGITFDLIEKYLL